MTEIIRNEVGGFIGVKREMRQVYVLVQDFPYEGHEIVCVCATPELAHKMQDDYNARDKEQSADGKFWKFRVHIRPLYES